MGLHCHKCGWGQDDFWSKDRKKGYSPFREDTIDWLFESLFKEKIHSDKYALADKGAKLADVVQDEQGYYVSGQEFVALELEAMARNIRNMHIKTFDEYKEVKDRLRCPGCLAQGLDLD